MYNNPSKLSHEEKDELIHRMAEALKACCDIEVFGTSRYADLYAHIQGLIYQAKGAENV